MLHPSLEYFSMSAYMSLIDSLKAFLMIDTRYFTLEIFIVPVNPMQLVLAIS